MMRVGGLATGMDIDEIVKKLMSAERMPLDRMDQDRTTLTWKRDGFREINSALLKLDNMMLDMKMSSTYNSKTVSSSQEAVKATATTSASNGSYSIDVEELATSAINVSGEEITIDPNQSLSEQGVNQETISFSTFDEQGDPVPHNITINEGDTLNDVLKRITNEDNHVRAFYDTQSNKVIMETTRTGKYNQDVNGPEISFEAGSFFTDVLKLDTKNEEGGTNAKFTYNNVLELESKNNNYTLNGITFEFLNKTEADVPATLTVDNDVESSYESIMEFIDTYNEVVETLNASQREEKFRDYKPLTEEQKKEMSEDEIELWEEKAKSGILRGESIISNGLFSMRGSWYSNVDTGGDLTSLTQIGIKTSSNYMDGGKLIVDEKKLKAALRENPDDVQKLFSNGNEDGSRGLINRLDDSVDQTMRGIEKQAGKSTSTLENYSLGKRMKALNEQISDFERRLVQVENRYWNQFTAMEKAISRMNQQSSHLMSQFGGDM